MLGVVFDGGAIDEAVDGLALAEAVVGDGLDGGTEVGLGGADRGAGVGEGFLATALDEAAVPFVDVGVVDPFRGGAVAAREPLQRGDHLLEPAVHVLEQVDDGPGAHGAFPGAVDLIDAIEDGVEAVAGAVYLLEEVCFAAHGGLQSEVAGQDDAAA